MNKSDLEKAVQEKLTKKRFTHTLGVAETAVKLAKIFGESEEKAYIAAMLHDYAKCMTIEEQRKYASFECDVKVIESYSKELLHAFAAVHLCKTVFHITDEEILRAIKLHTTGQENMTMLDKIIFLADYIEPNRVFPGVDEAREIVFQDLNQGMLFALSKTIIYLIEKKQKVYPETLQAYNYYSIYKN